MTRKIIDCRTAPNEVGCTLAISGEPASSSPPRLSTR